MIKSQKTEAVPEVKMDVPSANLVASRAYLRFPLKLDELKERRQLDNIDREILQVEANIRDYRRVIRDYAKSARDRRAKKAELEAKYPAEKVVSEEEALASIKALLKLAWIETVKLTDSGSLVVRTRKGMLKTTLNKRWVLVAPGQVEREFMDPITVSMPQYEIGYNVRQVQDQLANNMSRLAIKLIDKHDVSKFTGEKTGQRQEPHAHWASAGGRFNQWEQLCLGEYEDDLAKASMAGLVEFFSELALYLQMSDDEHAYRRKESWALWLGKPEYNEFCIRPAEKGETAQVVQERYRRDFKLMQPVEVKEGAVVNPGASGVRDFIDLPDIAQHHLNDGYTHEAPNGMLYMVMDGRWIENGGFARMDEPTIANPGTITTTDARGLEYAMLERLQRTILQDRATENRFVAGWGTEAVTDFQRQTLYDIEDTI